MHEITKENLKEAYPVQSWVDTVSEEEVKKYISESETWINANELNKNLYKLLREDKTSCKFDVILCALDVKEAKIFFNYFENTLRQEVIKKLAKKFWQDSNCQDSKLQQGARNEWEKMKMSLKGEELKLALDCWEQMEKAHRTSKDKSF